MIAVLGLRTRGQLERALNLSLHLVRVPRIAPTNKDDASSAKKNNQEMIAVAEQMLSAFSHLQAKGWNKFVYGEPYLALEIAVHHIGEETHFYIAVPKASEAALVKQVYAYFPGADVAPINDYNIFNPEGAGAGAYLTYSTNAILPVRTYEQLESDPLSGILTSLSKLQGEGEGAALQLLVRPTRASGLKKLAAKVAREMQGGKTFGEALIHGKKNTHPLKPWREAIMGKSETEIAAEKQDPTKNRMVTPADDEIGRAHV